MNRIIIGLLSLTSVYSWAQPATEVWLFDVTTKGGWKITNPINISSHPGYDNQPSFNEGQHIVYYSSFDDEGRSDIKAYDYNTGKTTKLTNTHEREYSPTLTPDGKFVSCIIQRDNEAQDLGKYPVDGGGPVVLINDLIVGYHAWVNEHELILFVLGEPMTLQWYNLSNGTHQVLAEHIGRSLHAIPGQQAMSYVDKTNEGEWLIKRLDVKTRESVPIVATLPGREDLTWTPEGQILMSDGEKIYRYDLKGDKTWKEVPMEGNRLKGITRLAMSKDGKHLAVAAAE